MIRLNPVCLWHFSFDFLQIISLLLLAIQCMKNIWEKLFTSVLIFTLCMDAQSEWLSASSQGKRSPCVRLHVPMTTGIPLWKRMKARIIFVRGEKQIYKLRQLLVIWSVSMRRWERWSVHKNTEDVHTYTKPKQTLLQDEMMNILCTYMETTLTVVYFDILWSLGEMLIFYATIFIKNYIISINKLKFEFFIIQIKKNFRILFSLVI